MESPTHYYAVEEECWKKDFKRSGIGLWKKERNSGFFKQCTNTQSKSINSKAI